MEAADVDKQQVHKVGRTVYTVPSASVAGATYTVDMDLGLCTCPVGCTGCGTHEHRYSCLKKAKSEASAQRLPTTRLAAPHSVAECVSRNVNLGKTHSTK